MRNQTCRFLSAILLGCILVGAPASVLAAKGDCGQPTSTGPTPTASDALTILKAAVGLPTACDARPCVCDVDGDGEITIRDALFLFRRAVGLPRQLNCNCVVHEPPFLSSVQFESFSVDELGWGWSASSRNSDLQAGSTLSASIQRRCSDNGEICETNLDCANFDCRGTCDFSGDAPCELADAVVQRRCLTTLKECEVDRCVGGPLPGDACTKDSQCGEGGACSESDDCPPGAACLAFAAPPIPFSFGGAPVCMLSILDRPLSGSIEFLSGSVSASLVLRSRVFLGIGLSQPCPRCGDPNSELTIGQTSTCEGGQSRGQTCVIDAISPLFGGTSFDCPPELAANISGSGLTIRLQPLTTETTTRTAALPCSDFQLRSNPLNAPADPGKCTDNGSACSSNSDCRRCSKQTTTVCSSNSDCTGVGQCAQAPDQPITCGYWCHCGFCDDNPSLPCFQNDDCSPGQTCQPGTGSGSAQTSPQRRPNACAEDDFVCGMIEKERCASGLEGRCSYRPYKTCSDASSCAREADGLCEQIEPRSCFEPRIRRTGSPSPLGNYCALENKVCTTNADCSAAGDTCRHGAMRPELVGMFCSPATASSILNNVHGLTGPGVIRLGALLTTSLCGDGFREHSEQCDDGNAVPGDGCDDRCQIEELAEPK